MLDLDDYHGSASFGRDKRRIVSTLSDHGSGLKSLHMKPGRLARGGNIARVVPVGNAKVAELSQVESVEGSNECLDSISFGGMLVHPIGKLLCPDGRELAIEDGTTNLLGCTKGE
jgi:hypothetical protein